jgi:chemosensory pili system protein ChpA (sensor histidine kinase/response regulator)
MDGSKGHRWILVVDDNTALRNVCLEVLQEEGYRAIGAADGLEAAELVQDLLPDLVVLDLHMPRASGWDFLESLRRRPGTRQIPIVIVSGYLHEGPDLTHTDLNVVRRIGKPVQLADLVELVEDILAARGQL